MCDTFDIPQDAVIMCGEPITNTTAEELRERLGSNYSEAELAAALAGAWNESGWLADEVDDEDCTPETENRYSTWWMLAKELVAYVIEIIKCANENGKGPFITSDASYVEILKPFMERNGYRDGRGWWVKAK